MNDKTLTDEGRAHLRELIRAAHVYDVIQVCEEYCREEAAYCAGTVSMTAIGREWTRAADHLAKAAEEIEP